MTTYSVTWDISWAKVADLKSIIETLREQGYPQDINMIDGTIKVQYEVALDPEAGAISDLWDLRGVAEEVADELGAYYDRSVTYSKPTEVTNA